jgi:hypothetical protein
MADGTAATSIGAQIHALQGMFARCAFRSPFKGFHENQLTQGVPRTVRLHFEMAGNLTTPSQLPAVTVFRRSSTSETVRRWRQGFDPEHAELLPVLICTTTRAVQFSLCDTVCQCVIEVERVYVEFAGYVFDAVGA